MQEAAIETVVPFEDNACAVEGELTLLPSGTYEAVFDTWETVALFDGRAQKLILWFALAAPPYVGVRLPRYYNVGEILGKPRTRGRFKVGPRSAFFREYCAAHGAPSRIDRLSVSKFQGGKFSVKVRTVKRVGRLELPEGARYSVIDCVVGRA